MGIKRSLKFDFHAVRLSHSGTPEELDKGFQNGGVVLVTLSGHKPPIDDAFFASVDGTTLSCVESAFGNGCNPLSSNAISRG